MKFTVRSNVFETNSSSVHSIVYKNQTLDPSELPINPKTGNIIGHFDEFGCTFDYDSQDMKLAYLLTYIYYLEGMNEERVKESWCFRELEEALQEYCGCSGLEIADYGEPYIDHQSVPDYVDEFIPFNKDSILNFIFNGNVVLHSEYD
jgi:hypothetical protein